MPGPRALDEVIYELVSMGAYVKVTAVDPISGIEASIVGNPRAGERALKETARRKLLYVLSKHQPADRARK